jgi:hypothetical protein
MSCPSTSHGSTSSLLISHRSLPAGHTVRSFPNLVASPKVMRLMSMLHMVADVMSVVGVVSERAADYIIIPCPGTPVQAPLSMHPCPDSLDRTGKDCVTTGTYTRIDNNRQNCPTKPQMCYAICTRDSFHFIPSLSPK